MLALYRAVCLELRVTGKSQPISLQVHTWLTQIGQVTLNHYNNMGRNLSTARDFQEIHERLVGDIKVSARTGTRCLL